MTDDEIRGFVAGQRWTFAKTMPRIPHWYTLRRNAPSDEAFSAFVQEIRLRGVQRPFGRRLFTYLDFEGWTYWTMGEPIADTTLINRARLPGAAAPPDSAGAAEPP